MPALEAFGRKWRVGSDDFVYPYVISVLLRVLWFVLVGFVLIIYDKKYSCEDEKLLQFYLFVLSGLHLCMLIVECTVIIMSARGTISTPQVRRWICIPLYIQTAFHIIEFAWDIVGVLWAFDPSIDCHQSHSVLILTRAVLVWNLFAFVIMTSYLLLRVGICRLPCFTRPPKKLRYELLVPEETYQRRRLSTVSSSELKHHNRQRTWQWRLQRLFCCKKLGEYQQSVFADISSTLTDAFTYFRGYVPSDILAGIAVLAMQQRQAKEELEEDCGTEYSTTRTLVDFNKPPVCKHFNKVVHYMKFAIGCYGYPEYIQTKGIVVGCCGAMSGSNCCCGKGPKARGDSCGWHTSSLKKFTGLQDCDIIYASFTSEIYCPAFYVAYDHQEETVVLAIRGSISLHDALTCLAIEPSVLRTTEDGDLCGHKGMVSSAHAVLVKLESEEILEQAFKEYPNYRLVVTGHSLGAGVASLLAMMLQQKYPKLWCFAYSPPGGVVNMQALSYTRSFITSVVLGNDLFARLRLESFEMLSEKVLQAMQTTHVPKYLIFLESFLYLLGVCRPGLAKRKRTMSVTQMAIDKDPNIINDFDANCDEEDIYDVVADMNTVKETDRVTGKQKIAPRFKKMLFIPGRIMHISWSKAVKKCCGLCTHYPLQAHWTAQSEFSELVLEKDIMQHHLPNIVLRELTKLQAEKKTLEEL